MGPIPYLRFVHQEPDITDEPRMPVEPPSTLRQAASTIEPYAIYAGTIYYTARSVLGLGLSAVVALHPDAACRIHPIICSRDPISLALSVLVGLGAIGGILTEKTTYTNKIRYLALGSSSLTYTVANLFLQTCMSRCLG